MTQEKLKELLYYNQENGFFYWRHNKGRNVIKPWDKAGSVNGKGYIKLQLNGKCWQAHRLAWLYVYGSLPSHDIDHINGIKSDNRISNLRPATNAQNHWNTGIRSTNKSGVKGVHWHKGSKRWVASCRSNGKQVHLGAYLDVAEASEAIRKYRQKHHGEYANHATTHGIGGQV